MKPGTESSIHLPFKLASVKALRVKRSERKKNAKSNNKLCYSWIIHSFIHSLTLVYTFDTYIHICTHA